jgi:hypothetical protein
VSPNYTISEAANALTCFRIKVQNLNQAV